MSAGLGRTKNWFAMCSAFQPACAAVIFWACTTVSAFFRFGKKNQSLCCWASLARAV